MPKPIEAMEPGIINYRIKLDKGEIMIQLIENSCSVENNKNNLSYAVKINYRTKANDTPKVLEGCGNFVPDPYLSYNWQIVKVGETVIDKDNLNGQTPYLNLDLINDSFSGNDGCNSFRGQVKFRHDKLIFGLSATTLMACPNMEITDKINKAITEKVLNYELGEYFILYEKEKPVLILKHQE